MSKGVPDAEARLSILNVLLSNTPHSISQDDLRAFSARAHGYVGADLSAIVREAGTLAIKRWLATPEGQASAVPQAPSHLTLTLPDLVASMPSVRPSAMRSVFVETPRVRYADIGGQTPVIQKLREPVEWPLLHPEAFQRLGVRPPKGVLLYGPPGCSKTVLARACACESGVNFVAVKGPEVGISFFPFCVSFRLIHPNCSSFSTNSWANRNAPCGRYSGKPVRLRLLSSSS